MQKEIIKQLKKYSPVLLSSFVYKDIEKLHSITNQGFLYDVSIMLLLAKINYFVPKILNYFDFKIYKEGIVFYNDNVELNVHFDDIVELDKLKQFAYTLKEYSGRKIHDFDLWFLYTFMKVCYLHCQKG